MAVAEELRFGTAPGAARPHLADRVPLLRSEEQVFEAMPAGATSSWSGTALSAVNGHEWEVRAFATHADAFPWTWSSALANEWFGDLRGVRGCGRSTLRGYQEAVRLFATTAPIPPRAGAYRPAQLAPSSLVISA